MPGSGLDNRCILVNKTDVTLALRAYSLVGDGQQIGDFSSGL